MFFFCLFVRIIQNLLELTVAILKVTIWRKRSQATRSGDNTI